MFTGGENAPPGGRVEDCRKASVSPARRQTTVAVPLGATPSTGRSAIRARRREVAERREGAPGGLDRGLDDEVRAVASQPGGDRVAGRVDADLAAAGVLPGAVICSRPPNSPPGGPDGRLDDGVVRR